MKGRWGGSKSKAEKRGLCVSRLQAIGSSPLLPPMPTPRMPRSKAAKKAQTQYAKAQSQGRNRTESGKHTQGEAERRCAHHFDRRAHVCMYAPSATDFLFSVAPDPADPSDSSPQDGSATGPALTFTVAGGRDDIISMWHTSLSRDEKHDILAIDVDELAHELDKLTGGVAILDASKIRELINNSEIMTAIRGMFVDALYNKGVMQHSLDPVVLTMLKILESHLLITFERRNSSTSLLIFIAFTVWISDYHWFLRYPCIALIVYMSWSSYPMLINLRLYWLTLIFEDNSPPRFKARGQATLCALMLATFASWQTPGLYKFYMVVASFPLILMEIETKIVSSADENGLKYIRMLLLFVSECILLYFTWFSWICTIFVLLFFFPFLTSVLISGACLGVSIVFPIIHKLQSIFISYDRHPFRYWGIWIVAFLHLIYSYIYNTYTWFYLFLNICVCMFTCPPIINTVIALCASGIASALIAFGLISVLVHGTKLAGVLCVAACIYIASKLCPTYHQRWQDRQEERRRKEEENM